MNTMTDDGSGDADDQLVRTRPDGASDGLVEAVGRVSEAMEYVERARGHLYSFHQLMGHADLTFGEAVELLEKCGEAAEGASLDDEVVGRNVLEGRWTFQIVEEFEELYHEPVSALVRDLEERRMAGRRHVFESEMKERRRTRGRAEHVARPPTSPSIPLSSDRDGERAD